MKKFLSANGSVIKNHEGNAAETFLKIRRRRKIFLVNRNTGSDKKYYKSISWVTYKNRETKFYFRSELHFTSI